MSSVENIVKNDSVNSVYLNELEIDAENDEEKWEKEKYHKKENYKNRLKIACKILVFVLITAYFIWATVFYYNSYERISLYDSTCSGYGFLLILYAFYLYFNIYYLIFKPLLIPIIYKELVKPVKKVLLSIKHGAIIFYVSFLVAVIAYLAFDTADNRLRLIPISGIVIFLLIGWIFSADRKNIPWRTVIWGMILQFLFGLFTIRWEVGRNIIRCVGDKVNIFLNYAIQGSAFVYSDFLVNQKEVFAFSSLATIFFIAFMINILYYYGIMQKVVEMVGEFLQWIMGTTICESVNTAANIFLSMTEAPLLLKPYLKELTDSEIHSIMTSGFATVAGTVMAAYIKFGADPSSLITASVMSAPAALCFSKMLYPETEKVKVTKENIIVTEAEFESVLDAAAKGAMDAFYLVSGIIASLIGFLSFIYFVNGVLSWLGELVGYTDTYTWSLDLIMGKIFIPISYIMGVPWDECEKVGKLVGLKTMVNEFVAYSEMGKINLTPRSKMIATFAICGFSNPGSIGIMISSMTALIPHKREAITKLVFRAFVGGALVCFMTACIAGMLMPESAIV